MLVWHLLLISLAIAGSASAQPKKIKLKNPSVTELANLCKNSELESLTLKGRVAGKLPACLSELNQLKVLKINGVNSNLDLSAIAMLQSLEELNLEHIERSELPKVILKLTRLKRLSLQGTQIKTLPDGLEHLERLDMRMIDLNRDQQNNLRNQYPNIEILFSSPCQCG